MPDPDPKETEGEHSETAEHKEEDHTPPNGGDGVIRIGIIPLALVFLVFAIGLSIFVVKSLPTSAPSIEHDKNGVPPIRETNSAQNPNDNKAGADKQEDKQKTGFIQDRGVYERVNSFNAQDVLKKRLPLAKKSIIWITGEPQNPDVLNGLSGVKNSRNIPIFIITGKDTDIDRVKQAQEFGFAIHRVDKSLESPYSIILIDSKLVIDISRANWIWETSEKNIIKDTANWANELIESAKIYH